MRCSKVRYLLQLYIDKRLHPDRMRAIEAHLSRCEGCQKELLFLETIEQALFSLESVAEPADLTENIMRRVALSTKRVEEVAQRAELVKDASFVLFRPSLLEMVSVVILATVATLGVFLQLPALRAALPIANGHDGVSLALMNAWNVLLSVNSSTLMLVFWVFGTALGVWITLLLAGSEMRTRWFKAIRLPVW